MTKEGYTISNIYQGGYSTFDPLPTSGYFTVGKLAETTDPRSANILQEVSAKLSSGVKNIEVEGVQVDVFDAIPKQQLKEVHRLSKLTGIDVSLHAPVINVSGLDPRSQGYSEAERESAERKVFDALKRSHELNPEGNIPVNFHSAEGIPGSQLLPPSERKFDEEEGYEKKHKVLLAVNQETGRISPLETDERFYPGGKKGKVKHEIYTPEKNLEIMNGTEWDNALSQLFFNKERADELLEKQRPLIENLYEDLNTKKISPAAMPPAQQQVYAQVKEAEVYLSDLHKHANALFSKAYKYGSDNQKKILDALSKRFTEEINGNKKEPYVSPFKMSGAMHHLLFDLQNPNLDLAPEIHIPLEQFANKTTSKTFGNAAFKVYKKFGDKAPILTIENPPAGFALSTGEDIKNLVEASRKEFVKKAKEKGMGEGEAKQAAEKIIGATLDVGHMNMLRKYGYSDKEIAKESEKMAPYLKHMHLSDNFGFEHTELPMGMGNVPTKEIMQKIEAKLGKKKTEELRKVIEAGNWWTHFRKSPFQATLEGMGTPIYSTGATPYWNQNLGFHQSYLEGYGQMLPQINYETFGAGFSQLPTDLGGQKGGGAGSRMSGKPME